MSQKVAKYFTRDELKCKHTGDYYMDADFLAKLDRIREKFGAPLIVTSAYRSPEHPEEAKKLAPGAHSEGLAVDFKVFGADAYRLIKIAQEEGVVRIGVNQKGPMDSRFVHLDDSKNRAHPWVWSY